jgi:hypothetical protein
MICLTMLYAPMSADGSRAISPITKLGRNSRRRRWLRVEIQRARRRELCDDGLLVGRTRITREQSGCAPAVIASLAIQQPAAVAMDCLCARQAGAVLPVEDRRG